MSRGHPAARCGLRPVSGALGAHRPWLTRVVHWQATTLVLLPAMIGMPLGLVAGRFVFTVFADSVGARSDASVPWLLLAAMAAGVVLLANIAASLPSRRVRRVRPATVLRAE